MIRRTNTKQQKRNSNFKTRRRRGSYLGITGKYPSPHNRHCLFYESFRERDLMVWLAYDPTVETVEDHPFTITYKDAGRDRQYTPDLLVHFKPAAKRRPLLVEVKTEAELDRHGKKFEQSFRAARAYCKSHRMQFEVITEKAIAYPRVRNLRFLFPYRREAAGAATDPVLQLLKSKHAMTLQSVIDALGPQGHEPGDVVAAVWRLAALQRIDADLDAPLSMNTCMEAKSWSTKI